MDLKILKKLVLVKFLLALDIKPTNQTDLLGKDCIETGESTFKYKESFHVPPLGYIDDYAGATKCGVDSIKLNVKTEETMKAKKLKLNEDKCHVMHIGKHTNANCPNLQVNDKQMKEVQHEKYLGQYISADGSNELLHKYL